MESEIDCSWEDNLPVPTDGNLPGDVMVSILLNLPVKSLLKFKSVSKAWYSLISSHTFFHLHLHRQSLLVPNTNNFLVSFGDYMNCNCDFGLLIHNEDNTSDIDNLFTLENQSSFSSEKEIVFTIDSCNGLVCLYTHSCGFILWNPATTNYRYLEFPEDDIPYTLDYSSFGLSYVEATNDFKLVGWTVCRDNPANRPYLFVYSLSSDSWETLDYDGKHPLVSIQHPTFISGCMNWLVRTCTCNTVCTCDLVFVTLDVTDESMSCFGAPDKNRGFRSKQNMRTFVIKGCLSIVVNPLLLGVEEGFDVWVMVEYGVEESWVKQFTIQGLTQLSMPLLTWNDSVIVFVGKPGLFTFYDPYSKKKYCRQLKSFEVNTVLNYVESLAPVEPEEGSAPYQQMIEG